MTHGEIIILSMLAQKDHYGYEIEKYIDKNMMRDWTQIGFSSIYHILGKLQKKGLIDFKIEDEVSGPKRKVYYILAKGSQEFIKNLIKMLKEPTIAKQDIDVAIVFSAVLNEEVTRKALLEYRAKVLESIEYYKKELMIRYADEPTVLKLFRRSILMMEADLKWVDEMITDRFSR